MGLRYGGILHPGDHDWTKARRSGPGKSWTNIVFTGKGNNYDDIVVEAAPDTDGDGFVDADEELTGHDKNDPGQQSDRFGHCRLIHRLQRQPG